MVKVLDTKKLFELEQEQEKLLQQRKYLMTDSKKYEWYTNEIELIQKEIDKLYKKAGA